MSWVAQNPMTSARFAVLSELTDVQIAEAAQRAVQETQDLVNRARVYTHLRDNMQDLATNIARYFLEHVK